MIQEINEKAKTTINDVDDVVITKDEKSDENASSDTKEQNDNEFVGFIKDGVEVVDVKVVPKGIPGRKKAWDHIS